MSYIHNGTPHSVKLKGKLDTHLPKPPDVYYVIVGCGFAATVNHSTLTQSEIGLNRLGDSKIMHIGFDDPWGNYRDHGMGQFPHMLVPPGYHTRFIDTLLPNAKERFAPQRSTKMGNDTKTEFNRLADAAPDINSKTLGWVALIQSKGDEANPINIDDDMLPYKYLAAEDVNCNILTSKWAAPKAPYRLLVVKDNGDYGGESTLIYADKIDICTGVGYARMHPLKSVDNPAWKGNQPIAEVLDPIKQASEEFVLAEEARLTSAGERPGYGSRAPKMPLECYRDYRRPVWENPSSFTKFGRIISGNQALLNTREGLTGGSSILLVGGGGVGVNLLETLAVGTSASWVDWIASKDFGSVNVADSERNTYFIGGIPIKNRDCLVEYNDKYTGPKIAGMQATASRLHDDRKLRILPYTFLVRYGENQSVAHWNWADVKFAKDGELVSMNKNRHKVGPSVNTNYWPDEIVAAARKELRDPVFPDPNLLPKSYRHMILNAGNDFDSDIPGNASFMLKLILGEMEAITTTHDNRLVGLQIGGNAEQDDFERIRILGASAFCFPKKYLSGNAKTAKEKTLDFDRTLPEQGTNNASLLPFTGLSVALANRFFANETENRNCNVNTATKKELSKTLTEKGLDPQKVVEITTAIIARRAKSSEGFAKKEHLEALLASPKLALKEEEKVTILEALILWYKTPPNE